MAIRDRLYNRISFYYSILVSQLVKNLQAKFALIIMLSQFSSSSVVVGIDPGTASVGFAFVTGNSKNPIILDYGILQTSPQSREQMPDRLLELGTDLESLINKYQPQKAIVEDLFFFKNHKTVISVAQSRGMLLYLLAKCGSKIESITPLQLKQTICGYGRASKGELQLMVQKLYNLDSIPKPDDAADALAMAWLGLAG
jgi:crossover junction endodeoxyribonuclease RuvC